MAETTSTPTDDAVDVDGDLADAPESFTTESSAETFSTVTPGDIITAPAAATGRRKKAIARVRIVPGTGQWTVNGRALDVYFPN